MLGEFVQRYGKVHSMKELAAGQLLVMYTTKESALSAYKEISSNAIGEPPITAEFFTESDIVAVVNASNNTSATATAEPPMSNLWPTTTSLAEHSQWNGGSSSMFSSAPSAWSSGGSHLDDHVVSGDLLGGQSM